MNKTLSVMVSSRCKDYKYEGGTFKLAQLRNDIKATLEKQNLFEEQLFDVWINEQESGGAHLSGAEQCCKKARDCDVFICLWNGHAGTDSICFHEYHAAIEAAPKKIRMIELPAAAEIEEGLRFELLNKPLYLVGKTEQEALDAACRSAIQACLDLAKIGVQIAGKGRNDSGPPLQWNRLDYRNRHAEMIRSLVEGLGGTQGATNVEYIYGKETILSCCWAVPDRFAVGEARAMAGRPQLQDHTLVEQMTQQIIGPVHFIACHRSVSEIQAKGLVGVDDLLVVTSGFGIYLADRIHKAQFLFLANCRDAHSVRARVEQARTWLKTSGEIDSLVKRAKARKQILLTVKENLEI